MIRTCVLGSLLWWSAALGAQRALLDELPADGEAWAHRYVGFGEAFTPLVLPGEGAVAGMAKCGKLLWIARGGDLFGVLWPELRVKEKLPAPAKVLAMAADERFVYALRESEILVLDAMAGRIVNTLPLGLGGEPTPSALAVHDDQLLVLVGALVVKVDKQTGAAGDTPTRLPGERVHWLASDGTTLWAGDRRGSQWRSASTSRWERRRQWPWPVHASAATWIDGRLLLVVAHDDAGGHPVVATGLLTVADPVAAERLSLKLYVGEAGVKYELGPKPLLSEAALAKELARIARDPSAKVPWPDGTARLLPVVLEPYPGVLVRDVKKAWDLVVAAGFPDVMCPAQEAWVREQARSKPASPGQQRK